MPHTEPPSSVPRRTALVTGANRGIGRATALRFAREGFHVIVAARNAVQAAQVVEDIRRAGGSAEPLPLDLADVPSIEAAAGAACRRHARLDVLVNNAAQNVGTGDSLLEATQHDIDSSLAVNAIGPLLLVKALLPALEAAPAGRIVNVSSTLGSISHIVDPASPYAHIPSGSYRLSKSVLNAITALMAKALLDTPVKVNAMCPGWTATDMGGAEAPNTVEQAAELALALGTLPADGPTGAFFDRAGAIPW